MKKVTSNPFLAVSYAVPELSSGTPLSVGRFLQNFMPDEVVLIGRPVKRNKYMEATKPTYRVLRLPTPSVGIRGERLWRLWSIIPGFLIGLYAIYRYKLKSILTFYRDEGSLLTGYLLHKFTNLPFYPYLFDLYVENYQLGYQGVLAAWLQPRVFTCASNVIVLSEGMRDYYQDQYNFTAIVLPHCALKTKQNIYLDKNVNINKGLTKVVYIGGINPSRTYSLKFLADVIGTNERYQINYFSPNSKESITEYGLWQGNVVLKYIPDANQLRKEIASCDILFLPASRDRTAPYLELQMITGFPTKTLDYLQSQRPILVHGQADFYISSFFKQYQCGHVVDGGAPEILAGLERLRLDSAYCAELVGNANIALKYFDGDMIANKFRKVLNG